MRNLTSHPPFIMAAPNGARRTKADHPNLPMTTSEIVAEAVACQAAGADALHLHVRDGQGDHSLDPGLYRETLAALAEALPGFPVQITTEAAGRYDVAQQVATLAGVAPKAASISVREAARDPDMAERLYALCAELGTQVQHILYSMDDLGLLTNWQHSGVVRAGQEALLFVLGQYSPPRAAHLGDVTTLAQARHAWTADWMVCAFGAQEQEVLIAAAAHGAQVRIGFENNLLRPDGQRARSTAETIRLFKTATSSQPFRHSEVA